MAKTDNNILTSVVLALSVAGSVPAAAQGVLDARDPDLALTLGLGAGVSPDYPGSDDLSFGPSGTFRFDFVRFPNGLTFGSLRSSGFREGFGLYGSARYIGDRDVSDHRELRGLDDVDWTLELGLGAGYESRNYRIFGDIRYGFNGHEGVVGGLGADLVTRPTDKLTVSFGPRLEFGDDSYASTYFGVTPAQSAAGSLSAFDAEGGLMSAGLEIKAVYQINDRWGVEGKASWQRLLNDAGDSPITKAGDDDQFAASLILTRSLSFDF